MAKIPCHTPKIVERFLATRQKTLKEAKRREYLTEYLTGVAKDLSRIFGDWLFTTFGIFTTFGHTWILGDWLRIFTTFALCEGPLM